MSTSTSSSSLSIANAISLATATFSAGVIIGNYIQQRRTFKANKYYENKPFNTLEDLIRPNILKLKPYRCARDDYSEGVLLDANENSYGPPLSKEMEHATLQGLERYPCPYQEELKLLIGHFRSVKPQNIFLGVGSDEAIDLLIRVTCQPGIDSILITSPTYGMYKVCAETNDVNILDIPLTSDFQLNVRDTLEAATLTSTKIIFLCNPGNPTARLLDPTDIQVILSNESYRGLVVVDEAYIDFSKRESLCRLVNKYERLVVLQTMSKGFGLAGIRLGMAFGDPRLIQILNNVKAPYNINKTTASVAKDAMRNLGVFRDTIDHVLKQKDQVMAKLRSLSYVKRVLPSDTNFVLFEIEKAYEVYQAMANAGVVIRYRGNLIHLTDCLRATIGTPDENALMLKTLDQVASRLGP